MGALTTAAAPPSTAPTTTSSTMTTHTTPQGPVLKGKCTHRSWPQLPEELVRHIATYYLWNRATSVYVPQTWDARELWHARIVYLSLRDAFHLERTLMSVCPQWGLALETHLFWQQAITLIDPTDSFTHLSIIAPPQHSSHLPTYRLSPYRHFRQIVSCTCLVCRINTPSTSRGLLVAKRNVNSYLFGLIPLCRDHEHRRAAFCGLCLRESQMFEFANNPALYAAAAAGNAGALMNEVGVLDNEDLDLWPGVEATCRSCRLEWLWKKASSSPLDQAAVGGPEFCSDDWETRQSVDGFIELGEGSIADIMNLAREKYWLRRETRLGDMMQQALAAAKFNSSSTTASLRTSATRGNGAAYSTPEWVGEEELIEEEEESSGEEDDTELMQLEEGGVKELALGDWARTRILDGYWISPADLWYRHSVPGKPLDAPAMHPCPWTLDDSSTSSPTITTVAVNDTEMQQDQQHPLPSTTKAPIPPSFNLCEQAFIAHRNQFHLILLPAMKNIVRRIAIECALDDLEMHSSRGSTRGSGVSTDPTLRASRMSLEEVLRVLREEEGVWYEGYDWVERRKSDVERQRDERRRSLRVRESDEVDSPTSTTCGGSGGGRERGDSSSSSVGSTTTSPVLSTTTLQTTPSPPPLSTIDLTTPGDEGELEMKSKDSPAVRPLALPTAEEVIQNKVLIPVEQVLNPPRVLRSIPYVPLTLEHLPQYSMEAFKGAWREACAPLYHCRCRICERAVAAANATGSPIATTRPIPPPQSYNASTTADSPVILQQPYPQQQKVHESPVEIQLQEVNECEYGYDGVQEAIDEYDGEEVYDSEDLDSFEEEEAEEEADVRRNSDIERLKQEEEEEEESSVTLRIPPSVNPEGTIISGRTRKRSSDEIEEDKRVDSPTKRPRKNGVIPVQTSATAERMQRKRSSEELDDVDGSDDDDDDGSSNGSALKKKHKQKLKRQRIADNEEAVESPSSSVGVVAWVEGREMLTPRSRSPTTTTTPATAGEEEDENDRDTRSRSRSLTISER